MRRKPPKAGDLIDALGQKKERRRRRSGRAPYPDASQGQFSLGALFLLMTVASLILAYFYYLGTTTTEEVNKFADRALHDAEEFHNNSAAEIIPLAACVVGPILAFLLGLCVFQQSTKRGLAVVWLVTCLSVLGVVLAVSLPTRPLSGTPLKDLQWAQLLPITLLALSCMLPLGAIGGWYARLSSRW